MAWDETLFGWLARHVATWRDRPDPQQLARTALAEPILRRLKILASAAAGLEVEVLLVDGCGGVGERTLQLPRQVAVLPRLELNAGLLALRAVLGGLAIGLRKGKQDDGLDNALGHPTAETLLPELQASWPGAWPLWLEVAAAVQDLEPVHREEWLWGRRLLSGEEGLATAPQGHGSELQREVTSEVRSRPRPPPTRRKVLKEHNGAENPVTHSFEKVHTAEDYKGGQKRADGADELRDHQAALDELDLDQVVLSATPTAAIYHADLGWRQQAGSPEEPELAREISYDEWDGGQQRYLTNWCSLKESRPEPAHLAGKALAARVRMQYRKAIAQVRAELAKQKQALRWQGRQLDGPEVDLDALVDRQSALRSGHDGGDRLYLARRRKGHDVAVMLLLDASMSTDSWVANRRVLDVERDAAVVLAEAFDEVEVEMSLAGFHSFSRSDCRFELCKTPDEPWAEGLERLAALQPAGYTRVGPALRHATALLEKSKAQRKLLILLTDGKPSDTDRYEGRWGQSDVRQAIREARQRSVKVFALSVDPRSRAHLPGMFGSQGYAGLEEPGELGRAVARIFERSR